jgi:hypothetical protein
VLAVAWGRRAGRESPDLTHYHVIHNWLWLGAVETLEQAETLTRQPAGLIMTATKFSVNRC